MTRDLGYRPGLDRIEEAVISAHFMQRFCQDPDLSLYDDHEFARRAVTISGREVREVLLPALLSASRTFARSRATAARKRAVVRFRSYGLEDPRRLGTAEFITEVIFDRQFRRGPRETCSRHDVRDCVARRIETGATVEMVIPALPYKFSCPLKSRGQLPDLAEVDFLLGLYEIAAAVETLYREGYPNLDVPAARFKVICDGSRFHELVNEPESVVKQYRRSLEEWVADLGLDGHIELIDYQDLVAAGLPRAGRAEKEVLKERARIQYSKAMWPIFDPTDMVTALRAAARIDPDPEQTNPQGRFVSLVKSLVFIVKYRSLDRFRALPRDRYRSLYRELTGHLFEPFGEGALSRTTEEREDLRRDMLREVWSTAIEYIAEIRSDRELAEDPVITCLPDHLRWTIHAKPGQLGLLSPGGLSWPVLAWAGTAAFKPSGSAGIRICNLPVLALEGAGAIPVLCEETGGGRSQPLFYLYTNTMPDDMRLLLSGLADRLVRRRAR